jgi:hypothetical protein
MSLALPLLLGGGGGGGDVCGSLYGGKRVPRSVRCERDVRIAVDPLTKAIEDCLVEKV